MATVITMAGVALIAVALRDTFHTVFHPSGHGSLASAVQRGVWRLFRLVGQHRPALLPLAGPLAMIATVVAWETLVAVGWALLYWPRLPADFLLATGLDPAGQAGFLDAFYLSLVTLATLGYGDLAPRSDWLRIIGPLEAFVGFGLITAAISWILSLYPVLARRRLLARQVALIRETAAATKIDPLRLDGGGGERLLADLASQLIAVRGDFNQFPVTYYFHAADERSALPVALPELARFATEAAADRSPGVRFQGMMLGRAVEEVAAEIGQSFLGRPAATADEQLRAYATDHYQQAGETGSRH